MRINKQDAKASWRERFSNRTVKDAGAPKLEVRAAADGSAEILLYDEIGYWGVTAKDFAGVLAGISAPAITVRINSPGGDVFDGLAMYNSLKAHPATINTVVDGLAASAASFIMLAGDTVTMAENSLVMIHKAWAIGIGNADDMTALSGTLSKIDGQIAGMYAAKNGKSVDENLAAMAAETWMTSDEAKEFGLVDSVVGDDEAAAKARASLAIRPQASAKLAVYDPDGDGDDDAAEAVSLITNALGMLTDAIEALKGTEPEGDDGKTNLSSVRPKAAATTPEWVVGADEGLTIDDKQSWDGPAAAERMLDAAGFNGDSPDPAKAKRGFLVWDHHNPKIKGSYKLPFADLIGGEMRAIKGGIDAAASRLPDTDIPDDVKTRARAVIDSYEKKMKPDSADNRVKQMRMRLALAAVD